MRQSEILEHGPVARASIDHAGWWRARLADLGERTCFVADLAPRTGAAPSGAAPAVAVHTAPIPPELSARLDRMSRGRPAALQVILTAAAAALLRCHTRAGEVVVGQPTPAEPVPVANPMLVLRVPAEAGQTFRGLLAHLRGAVLGGVEHMDCSLWDLAPELGRAPGPGENPYFDVAASLGGSGHPGFASSVPVRVLFEVERDEAGDRLAVRYDATRFTADAAGRMARHYLLLLERASAHPDLPLDRIDLRTAEDARVLEASNDTATPFEEGATVPELFARQAAATPAAPALVGPGGTLTHAELAGRVDRLARTLRERGVGPGDVVGVLAERSPEMIVAVFAVLAAGGAYLPLDPGYPKARIDFLLRDSGARLVLARSGLAGSVDADVLDLDDPGSYATAAPPSEVSPSAAANDLAYVIYTSGSTGTPKGVMVEHRSVVNRLAWMQRTYPIGPGDVILQKTSISFDVSVWELFWWAGTGATLALPEPGAERDPAAIVAAVERHGVSTMHFVPSMLAMFLGHVERFDHAGRLGSLRQVFASGEALGRRQAERFAALVPGARLVNLYGPTEATVDVTHQPCEGLGDLARVPIGRPIDNIRLYVLDGSGRPAPVGVPGELHIAGVGVARGYLGRPDLTAERFVPGGAVGEDRLYRTGDLARLLPDGALDYLGRMDQQVKVRGFRVEPGEVEELLRAHPEVRDAAVVAHDDGWQTSLRAYVTLAGTGEEPDLKAYLRRTLPEYMVPSRVVPVDELPLTPSGKLDRAALARPDGVRRGPAHVAPRTEAERVLAGIWSEVLGLPRVGVTDNFFALGGNSIHFVSVLAKARAAGLDFTFQELFRHQSIAALAAVIESAGDGRGVARGRGEGRGDGHGEGGYRPFELLSEADRAALREDLEDAEDAYPLSMLQAGLIFQTEITGGRGQYHDVLGYLIRGSFDREAFERAVRAMVRRHPILRTTYRLTGYREFVQVVHRDAPPPLSVVDLRGRSREEQERFNDGWVAAEKARRFVWEEGGLVGLHVQILRDDLFRYTVSQHNSALDGWSISLLHTQLFDLYHRFREGREPAPWGVDGHLRDFVGLERAAVESPASRDFWLGVLDGATPTAVPRRPGAVESDEVDVTLHDVPLPAGLTERVVALADGLSVPVKDVLLAAHVKVLAVLAGEGEVTTGYEHSGRPELPGAESALGLFLNTVPLRIEVSGGSWEQLIRRVYQAELDLLPHRRYPMARMKQDLGTRRPLFETTFNFTHFYLLKSLRELPEFALLDMRVDSATEFVFRTEFSRHFFDDDVRLSLHYRTHLFDAGQIDRIGRCFVRALELMTGSPGAQHEAQPLGAEAERPREAVAPLAVLAGRPPTEASPPDAGAPAGSVAARIAGVWARVLDVPADRIRPTDGFFDLGGNSLSALRAVLELDGLVTLGDLTRHPRLDRLARLVERRAAGAGADREGRDGEGGEELLHLLSEADGGAKRALVCVPYPAGHPINFRPLADALGERDVDLAVYAVQEPGHDPDRPGPFAGVVETARRLVAEIGGKIDAPVALWGHCGGAAVTVEVARQLQEQGADLRAVFVGSKLLPTPEEMRDNIATIQGWSDRDVIRFMVDQTGYTDLDGLDARRAEFAARVFRHDVVGGYRYLIDATDPSRRGWRLEVPFWFVVAADDRGLARYPDQYRRWGLLAGDVRLHVMQGGGHYFVRSNPAGTAELIRQAWPAVREG